jgi:hypothetical protein
MPDNEYTKADLLWEATRRNQEYKNDYASALEVYRNKHKLDADTNITYLPTVSSNRWNIHMKRITEAETETRIQVLGWLDPCIDIDEIKREISSGVPALSVHPYEYANELTRTKPDIYYHQIKRDKDSYFIECQIDNVTYICINKIYVRNKFLFLIEPTSKDESILSAVQETKKKVLKCIKDETDSLKKRGVIIFYPRDIEKYIGWLKKYDEIVDHLIKYKGVDSLTYEKGAVIVPDKFSFSDVVPNETLGDKFEGQRKAYRDAYKGAVKLIQTTPNILFSPSRT